MVDNVASSSVHQREMRFFDIAISQLMWWSHSYIFTSQAVYRSRATVYQDVKVSKNA